MYMTGDLSRYLVEDNYEVIEKIRSALADKRVLLAYQPIVLARDPETVFFYEGLIRAIDGDGRVMSAGEFIDAVEPTRLGREIDCLALRLALADLEAHPTIRISINVSMRSIGYARWEKILDASVNADPTIAERLIIELTESAAVRSPRVMMQSIDKIRRKGVSIALDDFGKAHSTVTRLKAIPLDFVKIDADFCRGVARSADNRAIVTALISMAKHFDTIVVAEGIQDRLDAAWLADAGVDCLQGYLLGAPKFDHLARLSEEEISEAELLQP